MLAHKIVVLTDLHFLTQGNTILAMDPAERLSAAIRKINATVPDAAHVIITGDLTHLGEDDAYVRLRAVLRDISAPVTLTVGNHDRREVFLAHFPEAAKDEHGFIQSTIDIGGYRLIVLDTLDDSGAGNQAISSGYLCERRLGFLEQALRSADGRPAIIFMHHPPHKVGFVGMDRIRLRNGEAFYELISGFPNVEQIICGHVHRSISGAHNGIPFAIFKSTVDQQPFDFTLTDTKLSIKEAGEFGVLLLSEHGVVVQAEDF